MVPMLLINPGASDRGFIASICPVCVAVCARSGVIIFVTGEGEGEGL